jgi:cytochrome c
MKFVTTLIAATVLAVPAFADDGDAAKGEKEFNKCKACHSIEAADGTVIVKGSKVGPNLYGVIGRTAGTVEDFKYSDSLKAAGEAGLVWGEDNFAHYLEDPAKFLKEYLNDPKAKSAMTFKLRKGGEDIMAYLVSVSPAPEAAPAAK